MPAFEQTDGTAIETAFATTLWATYPAAFESTFAPAHATAVVEADCRAQHVCADLLRTADSWRQAHLQTYQVPQ